MRKFQFKIPVDNVSGSGYESKWVDLLAFNYSPRLKVESDIIGKFKDMTDGAISRDDALSYTNLSEASVVLIPYYDFTEEEIGALASLNGYGCQIFVDFNGPGILTSAQLQDLSDINATGILAHSDIHVEDIAEYGYKSMNVPYETWAGVNYLLFSLYPVISEATATTAISTIAASEAEVSIGIMDKVDDTNWKIFVKSLAINADYFGASPDDTVETLDLPNLYLGEKVLEFSVDAAVTRAYVDTSDIEQSSDYEEWHFVTDYGTIRTDLNGTFLLARNELSDILSFSLENIDDEMETSLTFVTSDTPEINLDFSDWDKDEVSLNRYVQFYLPENTETIHLNIELTSDSDFHEYVRTDRAVDVLPEWMSWRNKDTIETETVYGTGTVFISSPSHRMVQPISITKEGDDKTFVDFDRNTIELSAASTLNDQYVVRFQASSLAWNMTNGILSQVDGLTQAAVEARWSHVEEFPTSYWNGIGYEYYTALTDVAEVDMPNGYTDFGRVYEPHVDTSTKLPIAQAESLEQLIHTSWPAYYIKGGKIIFVNTSPSTTVEVNLWTYLDEWGALLDLKRHNGEDLERFKERLLDISQHKMGASEEGLLATAIRELDPTGISADTFAGYDSASPVSDLAIYDIENESLTNAEGFPEVVKEYIVREQRKSKVHTWDNSRINESIWNANGEDYEGHERLPYKYDKPLSELSDNLESGSGPTTDILGIRRASLPVSGTVTISASGMDSDGDTPVTALAPIELGWKCVVSGDNTYVSTPVTEYYIVVNMEWDIDRTLTVKGDGTTDLYLGAFYGPTVTGDFTVTKESDGSAVTFTSVDTGDFLLVYSSNWVDGEYYTVEWTDSRAANKILTGLLQSDVSYYNEDNTIMLPKQIFSLEESEDNTECLPTGVWYFTDMADLVIVKAGDKPTAETDITLIEAYIDESECTAANVRFRFPFDGTTWYTNISTGKLDVDALGTVPEVAVLEIQVAPFVKTGNTTTDVGVEIDTFYGDSPVLINNLYSSSVFISTPAILDVFSWRAPEWVANEIYTLSIEGITCILNTDDTPNTDPTIIFTGYDATANSTEIDLAASITIAGATSTYDIPQPLPWAGDDTVDIVVTDIEMNQTNIYNLADYATTFGVDDTIENIRYGFSSTEEGLVSVVHGDMLLITRRPVKEDEDLYVNHGYFWVKETEDYLYADEKLATITNPDTDVTLANIPPLHSHITVADYTHRYALDADKDKTFSVVTETYPTTEDIYLPDSNITVTAIYDSSETSVSFTDSDTTDNIVTLDTPLDDKDIHTVHYTLDDSFYVIDDIVYVSATPAVSSAVAYEGLAEENIDTDVNINPLHSWWRRYFVGYEENTRTVDSIDLTLSRRSSNAAGVPGGSQEIILAVAHCLDTEGNPVEGATVVWTLDPNLTSIYSTTISNDEGRCVNYLVPDPVNTSTWSYFNDFDDPDSELLADTTSAATTTTITSTTNLVDGVTFPIDHPVGDTIRMVSGTYEEEESTITDVNYTTNVFTFAPAFTGSPGAGQSYTVLRPLYEEINYLKGVGEVKNSTLQSSDIGGIGVIAVEFEDSGASGQNRQYLEYRGAWPDRGRMWLLSDGVVTGTLLPDNCYTATIDSGFIAIDKITTGAGGGELAFISTLSEHNPLAGVMYGFEAKVGTSSTKLYIWQFGKLGGRIILSAEDSTDPHTSGTAGYSQVTTSFTSIVDDLSIEETRQTIDAPVEAAVGAVTKEEDIIISVGPELGVTSWVLKAEHDSIASSNTDYVMNLKFIDENGEYFAAGSVPYILSYIGVDDNGNTEDSYSEAQTTFYGGTTDSTPGNASLTLLLEDDWYEDPEETYAALLPSGLSPVGKTLRVTSGVRLGEEVVITSTYFAGYPQPVEIRHEALSGALADGDTFDIIETFVIGDYGSCDLIIDGSLMIKDRIYKLEIMPNGYSSKILFWRIY